MFIKRLLRFFSFTLIGLLVFISLAVVGLFVYEPSPAEGFAFSSMGTLASTNGWEETAPFLTTVNDAAGFSLWTISP